MRKETIQGMDFFIAFIVLVCVMTLNLFAAAPLQEAMGLWGTAVAELLCGAAAVAGAVGMIAAARKAKVDGVDGDVIFSSHYPGTRKLIGSLLIGMAAFFASALYSFIMYYLLPEQMEQSSASMQSLMAGCELKTLLIAMALFPAICEELVFRGVTQYAIGRYAPPRAAILITGVIFGLFHVDPIHIPSAAMAGIALSYALWRTGSILAPMIMHFTNNAASLIISYTSLAAAQGAVDAVESAGVSEISLLLFSTAELVLVTLGSLLAGLALMEEHPVEAFRRHRVTVLVLVLVVLLLGTGSFLAAAGIL